MTGLTIAALVVAALCAAMLIAVLVQISSLASKIDELAAKLKTISARLPASHVAPAVEERLVAIETGLKSVPVAFARLEHSILAERREARSASIPAPPPAAASSFREDRPEAMEPALSLVPPVERRSVGGASPSAGYEYPADRTLEDDVAQPVTPDELIDAYRELIARPRKNEITRWFDDLGGTPCEATDENVFQTVGRGDGARLMLVQLTERFGLVLPSALMVVDFATSFADVLSARSATRQTFAFDADGSGTLRLVEPAMAVLVDGVWKLKAPGRLAGLASG